MSENVLAKDVATKNPEIGEMFSVGAHFGFSRSRRHPSVKDFIFGYKNRTAVIDLEKTLEMLTKAEKFVEELGKAGKAIILVGSKSEARDIVASAANRANMPYVAERWIGGTFTNFKAIKKRIERLKFLKQEEENGGLSIYTKKERNVILKELSDLKRYFESVEDMDKLPSAMFVVDPKEEAIAVTEADKINIPVIGLANSDCDLKRVKYPIIANDASKASIKYFTDRLVSAYERGKKSAPEIVPEEKKEAVEVSA